MKRALMFVALFLCVDRFMDYRINKARRQARVAMLKRKRYAALYTPPLKEPLLPQSGQSLPTQVGKGGTTTS